MFIEPPIIPDKSVKVIAWAEKMLNANLNVPLIFSILLSDKLDKNWNKNEEAREAREIFREYSPSRQDVLLAIQIQAYRRENTIKEGQIVTDGEKVGYAFTIDYKMRTFELHKGKTKSTATYLDTYELDAFKKVQI